MKGRKLAVLTDAERAVLIWGNFRFFLYTLLITAFMLSMPMLVRNEGAEIFREGHWIESIQMALLAATALVFFAISRLVPAFDVLCRIMALFCLFAVIREGDNFWDGLLGDTLGWQLPGTLVFLAIVITYARQRTACNLQLAHFMTMRAMTLLWAGFIVAIPIAQMMGNGPMFRLLMHEDYVSSFKRLIEEALELVGYMMIFFSSLEHFYQTECWRRLRGR